MAKAISLTVNGKAYSGEAEPRTLLVHFLRDNLGLTGTHVGCVVGRCGACTVLWRGKPVKSCMGLSGQAHCTEVKTGEGPAPAEGPHPFPQGLWGHAAPQSGRTPPRTRAGAH